MHGPALQWLFATVTLAPGVMESFAHAVPAQGLDAASPAIVAIRTHGTLTPDGMPEDTDWAQAPATGLTQQDPHPGKPTRYRSEVRLLTDSTHLYVRIDCVDPDFIRRSVHTLERDSDQTSDDHVTVVLDTFGNHRVGYVFQVNAGGARSDGLISPASRDPSYDWDGVWDAKVRQTADGWSAEIAIDSRSLQFRKGLDRWGFNVQRYVPRDQLKLQWANINLDASIFDLGRVGRLDGVGNFEQGLGLEVTPYVLIRHDSVGNRSSAQVGGDVRYNVTPELAGIVTINPDFAEAEADAQQINLTRFSLFFPEKRRFFLEGSNQFTFGAGLNDIFIPFYSRNVGLVNGATVRLDEGIKIIGQSGPWAIGALDVETGRSSFSAPTNLFAGHLTYDVDEHLRIGTLVTRGDPMGKNNNQFTGFDAVWQTATFRGDKNLTLAGWTARSNDDTRTGQHSGWGLYAQYPNDLWSWNASVNVFGDALNPALGFLPRSATRRYDVYTDYRPRPTFDRYRFEAQSSDARPWRIGNVVEIGDFYTGRLTQTMPFVNWTTLEGKLRFEFSNETDSGYLPQGNFIQRLYQLKASYSFSPDLNVSSFAQYDSSAGHIGINTRLHWILAPGSDFFMVFNHGVEASVADPAARLARVSNAVVAKPRWDFRP